jgi:hypothetical protein
MSLNPEEIRDVIREAQARAREKVAAMHAEGPEKSKIYHAYSLTGAYEEVGSCFDHLEEEVKHNQNLTREVIDDYLAKAIGVLAMSYAFAVEILRLNGVKLSDANQTLHGNKIQQADVLTAILCQSNQNVDANLLYKISLYSGQQTSIDDWVSAIKTVFPGKDLLDEFIVENAATLLSRLHRPAVENMQFLEMFDPPGSDTQGYIDAMNECKSGVGLKEDFSPDVRSFHLHISVYPDVAEMTFYKNNSGIICHQAELKFTDLPTCHLKDYFHYHAVQETPGLTPRQRQGLDQERKTLHLRLAVYAKVKLERQGITFVGAAAEDFTRNLVSMFLDVRQKWLDRQKTARHAPGRGGGPA